jgi:hypothetical protein
MATIGFISKEKMASIVSWQVLLAMTLLLTNCGAHRNITITRKFITKEFRNAIAYGFTDSKKLEEFIRVRNTGIDTADLNIVFKSQNFGIFYDSLGRIKDLVASSYSGNKESFSIALQSLQLPTPKTTPTVMNRLPQKLDIHISDVQPFLNLQIKPGITIDTNNVIMLFMPQNVNKEYIKIMHTINWNKVIEKNKFSLFVIIRQ